jgi:adenylate cyclase
MATRSVTARGKGRRILFRVSAFRLALTIGLFFTFLHYLEVASLARDAEVPVVSRLEHATQDYVMTRLRPERRPSGDVVIVAIDEKSVRAEGLWPWSRAKLARLVDELARGGVRAVGFDMIWAEDDQMGRRMARVASLLEQVRSEDQSPALAAKLQATLTAAKGEDPRYPADVDPTEQLASAIEKARNVSIGFLFATGRATAESQQLVSKLQFFRTEPVHVPDRLGRLERASEGSAGSAQRVGVPFADVDPPRDEILAVADSGGFFNTLPDMDGVMRRYLVVGRVGESLFPALGTAVLARAVGKEGLAEQIVPVGAASGERVMMVKVGSIEMETDDAGRVALNYYGKATEFPTWSATDVLNGRIPAGEMRGKVAMVGNTAAGTWDQRVTPFDESAPGVITHATFLENALHGELLRRSLPIFALETGLMALLSVVLAWVFSRVRGIAAVPALLAALAIWEGFAWLALTRFGILFAMGLPLFQMIAMFGAATSYRVISEEREKRRARETFSRFLAPAIVEELLARGQTLKLGGEKRELTVLFADIRGFTTLSEQLDPPVLLELLNEYLTPMTEIIVSGYSGTLDKYIGDAVMAFWGAPKELPDHPLLACKAALAMVDELQALRPRWIERGLPAIDIGIGINSGQMSVGFVGSQDRFYNYTVLGDAVNLASRLEGINKTYGTRIIISGMTFHMVKEAVVARELDSVRVKGKREPVLIYELLGLAPPKPEQSAFLEEFTLGLTAYKEQRFEEAAARFTAADAMVHGDPCSREYLARCQAMRQNPPGPQWDGVYEMKTK